MKRSHLAFVLAFVLRYALISALISALASSLASTLASAPASAATLQYQEVPKPVADSGASGQNIKAYYTPVQAALFAKQVERSLATKSARLALVFRAGRPRSQLRDGIAYTHGAIWVYGDITGTDGKPYKGYAVYNLYQGDGRTLPIDQSYLAQDFPLDFISGSQADDVGIIIPSPEMQKRILMIVTSKTYQDLHIPSYSLVSNPYSGAYQNCTGFLLDVVAAATWQTEDPVQIRANLKANFHATRVHANLFERVLGPAINKSLKMDDQSAQIETTTYESLSNFMVTNNLVQETYSLKRDNSERPQAESSFRPGP